MPRTLDYASGPDDLPDPSESYGVKLVAALAAIVLLALITIGLMIGLIIPWLEG